MKWLLVLIALLAAALLLVIACLVGLFLLLAIFSIFAVKGRRKQPGTEQLKGWNYAHRGLHSAGKPENSMAAFQAALENGCGVELDVHLLQDGELAIIHDFDLSRCTNQTGKVESLTAAQLKDCYLEGTGETIPTLRQVLQLFDGKAPLIIELKVAGDNYGRLVDRVMAELENYSGVYCLESFDPRCLSYLKKHYPQVIRGQLSENYLKSRPKVPMPVWFVMTFLLGNFYFRPDFVAYKYEDRKNIAVFLARRLWKMTGVSWTLKTKEEYDQAVSEGWIPIFEGFEP